MMKSKKKNWKQKKQKGGAQIVKGANFSRKCLGETLKKGVGNKECNMDTERSPCDSLMKGRLFYTPKKLTEKLNISKLKEKEKLSVFIKDFLSVTLKNFCLADDEKYLKYCINLLDCLEDTIKLDDYLMKIYNKPEEDRDKYFKNFATFLVEVVIKAIVAYDKKYPRRSSFITIKKGLCRLFGENGLQILSDKKACKETVPPLMANITIDALVEKFKTSENNIMLLIQKDIEKDDGPNLGPGGSSIKKKNEKQPNTYAYVFFGTIFFSCLLFMNVLDSPPGVKLKHGAV